MPKFLEDTLKATAANKGTAKGARMDAKHAAKLRAEVKRRLG